MRIQLVCQFGEPVRGLSPYGDALREAMGRMDGLEVDAVDFRSAYPGFLHPAESGGLPGPGDLSWYSPASWRRVATRTADIIHIQHWAAPLACYLWPLACMARRQGKRVVITVHNPSAHESMGAFKAVEDRFLRSADMLVAHARSSVAMLQARLGPGAPGLRCIPHGMEVQATPVVAAAEDYTRLGLDPGQRYVLLFGNLRGYKGVDVLLDAWQEASAHLDGVHLVIAGRMWGGGQHRLSRLSARLLGTAGDAERLKRKLQSGHRVIVRQGFQSDVDIDALVRICACAVFPYVRFSGQSGAACRAAANGRAVLVSKVGGLPELAIDESWMVDPDDVGGLAETLVHKLRDPVDRDVHGALQLDAIRGKDWSIVASEHARMYRELA